MRLKDQLQKRPVAGAIAIVSFFIVQSLLTILFDEMLGPVKCNDGYASPSIGRSGACSSHGGVDRSRDALIALLSVAGAGAIFIWCAPIGRSSHAQQCDQRVSSSVDAAVRGAGSTTTDRRRRVTISAFYRAEHFVKNIVSALCKMKNDAIAITPATGRFCN